MAYGAEIALVAAVVAAAGTAYVSYESSKTQAKMGQMDADMRREQAITQRQTASLQAKEAELERQRRARLQDEQAEAMAYAFGVDPTASGSFDTLATENRRQVLGDVTNIRLLGASRGRQAAMVERAAGMEHDVWSSMGQNAWIKPTLGFISSVGSAGMGYGQSLAAPSAPAGQPRFDGNRPAGIY